ncbi:replication factor C subunit 4-like [Rhopilema esculentum]|uniref:replication factor C subunit 4-like n=1 Tax=Rhopilema esculentum TaxID=499914 RepID=UPI0031D9F226
MDFFAKRKGGDASRAAQAGPSGKSVALKVIPWVEKYRPKTVGDVAYQDEVVAVLEKTISSNEFPHFLFYGPPGTGKTSTILAVSKQLFGQDLYRSRVLELNASDERGIQVIREKVKTFSMQAVSATKTDGTPCPPFKIVILDEADSMTSAAQASLRRTMERQSKTTRFCLICNYVSRIIEPLTSRCSKFRFKPLSTDIIKTRLQRICDNEGVKISSEGLEDLINLSEGDMRKAITFLQSASRLKSEVEITPDDIMEIAGAIPSRFISSLVKTCYSGSYEKVEGAVKDVIFNGFSGAQFLNQIHDHIINMESINDNQKSVIMEKIAECDKCLCDGADEYLQIMALMTVAMEQVCSSR